VGPVSYSIRAISIAYGDLQLLESNARGTRSHPLSPCSCHFSACERLYNALPVSLYSLML
jgi:hypothetical protein